MKCIDNRNSDAALYLDFEDDRLAGFTPADFSTVQDAFLELRPEAAGRIVYLFDEIQHVEDWERFCRRVTERENAAVYVTGSSSKLMPLEGEEGFAAFQVCRELTDENRFRETRGLLAACRRLQVTKGTILTDDQEWEEEAEGITIVIRPVWRWLGQQKN